MGWEEGCGRIDLISPGLHLTTREMVPARLCLRPAPSSLLLPPCKVIRSNETMFKAGQTELTILRKLADADPDNRRHVIRLLGR